MRLTFLGAAEEVTGSCYLLESGTVRFLVDCGMFQGGHGAQERNRAPFRFDVRTVDFVLLTHAHIDHSGLLPRLAAEGYRGPVFCTVATADLLEVMLPDSAHIQESEAEWAARHPHRRAVRPQPPLYTQADARAALDLLERVEYDVDVRPAPGIRVRFRDAGHILGSAILEVFAAEDGTAATKIVFSGDLGQPGRPLLRDPTPIDTADVLLVESTYGNRLHRSMTDTLNELVAAVESTQARGGNVIMPAFAVGRTQEILYLLIDLVRTGRLKDLDVFVDSPMALKATAITYRHLELLDAETHLLLEWQRAHPRAPSIRFVETVAESMALNDRTSGAIILAASGMCDAGRIKHHLRHHLGRPECAVVITGFQAAGTLGRRLVDGAGIVTLFGEEIAVRASVHTIGGLSAHADRDALLGWLANFRSPPRRTFVVHGESSTAIGFASLVGERLGWSGVQPAQLHGVVELTA